MSNKFGEAFSDLRLKAGYSKLTHLSKASGISLPVLSRLQSGQSQPRPDTLKKLAPHLGVSYEELMRLAGHLPDDDNWKLDEVDEHLLSDDSVKVFVLDNVCPKSFGTLLYAEYLPEKYKNYGVFYLRVNDDSMVNAGIYKNDIVLVKENIVVDNGDIAVVSINNNNYVVRKYFRLGDKVVLLEECANGRGIVYGVENVSVDGKAVRIVRDLE
jgi:repressor LexA